MTLGSEPPGSAPAAGAARRREVAWRIFAQELTSSSVQERGSGEKAPSHVLTPWGARVSRVLMVGELSQVQKLGREGDPFWRGRLRDATGGVLLTAGSYQPRALAFLSRPQLPARVAVVGKASLFPGASGVSLFALRAEDLREADEEEERRWTEDTAQQSLERLDLLAAVGAGELSLEALLRRGFPRRWAESALASRGRYPSVDASAWRSAVERLARIPASGTPAPAVRPADGAPPPSSEELRLALDLVEELAATHPSGWADERELCARARGPGASGPPEERMRRLLEELVRAGHLERPAAGKVARPS